MKKNHLVLLTGIDDFFGQRRRPWVSMNVARMIEYAQKEGFTVEKYHYHQLVNGKTDITDSLVFYSFSQKANYRDYILDLIHHLQECGNVVIPPFDLLMCHEDKGYQELYKRRLGIESLKAWYFSSRKELQGYEFPFPLVVKQSVGSNAKRVFLVHNRKELEKVVKSFEKISLYDRYDLFRRRYLRPKKHYPEYPDYSNYTDYLQYREYVRRERNFVLQEFVPNLTFDYRVLIFFDRYYVMKRLTRKNDFRASGAKAFELNVVPEPPLLHYAKSIYEKFQTPFLSLDIGCRNNNFYLFEFQALHFGIATVMKQKGYYRLEDGSWHFHESIPDIEREIMGGLIRFIRAKY